MAALATGSVLDLPLAQVQTVVLASVRVAGFVVVAPPFASKQVPGMVKVALALGLGLAVTPRLTPVDPDTTAAYLGAVVLQVVVGLALGFGVSLVFAAVASAGAMLDQFGGFSMAQAFDPFSQSNAAILQRLYEFLAVALLFATDGYQLVLRGLARSFDAVPLTGGLDTSRLATELTHALTQMVLATLEIAGPLVVVLFLTDIGLGLLTRVAPALNALALGFPLKILVTLVLVGFALLGLPHVLSGLSDSAVTFVGRAAATVTPTASGAGG